VKVTSLRALFPILEWGSDYSFKSASSDLTAAIIVTVMLIPQSLAYAMLAGLPAQMGLYASVLPLIAYGIFGSSRTLSVGPVAILSLMTASAAGQIDLPGSEGFIEAAMVLAILSGLILLLAGVFRLGFLANFISHPVVSGFITASGILIAASQIKHLLGIQSAGHNLPSIGLSLINQLSQVNIPTLILGSTALFFLLWSRKYLKSFLSSLRCSDYVAIIVSRAAPIAVVVISTLIVALLELNLTGVSILGTIPSELPALNLPNFSWSTWSQLLGAAALISLIGFVESVSVGRTLGAKRRQRIYPNQELIALGTSNLAAGCSTGFPVTGGLSRSAVNFDGGASTPAAGIFTALGIATVALFFTQYLYFLPQAVLAATIIAAVLTLIDFPELASVYRYSKAEFISMLSTILVTLLVGVEIGITTGIVLSLVLHIYKSSQPHFAVVGQVPNTHHFRNVDRHKVITSENVMTIRIDESLYFANTRFLEDTVYSLVTEQPKLSHVILMCPAINHIDSSALDSLDHINQSLSEAGIKLHLSEVKGPVMDKLKNTGFLNNLSGNVYLHQHEAVKDINTTNNVVTVLTSKFST